MAKAVIDLTEEVDRPNQVTLYLRPSGNDISRRVVLDAERPKLDLGRASKHKERSMTVARDNGWLDSPIASRTHACISANFEQKTLLLRDLESTHGTWLNGHRLRGPGPATIEPGDRITIGQTIHSGPKIFLPRTFKVSCNWEHRPPLASGIPTPKESPEQPQPARTFSVPNDSDSEDMQSDASVILQSRRDFEQSRQNDFVSNTGSLYGNHSLRGSSIHSTSDHSEVPLIKSSAKAMVSVDSDEEPPELLPLSSTRNSRAPESSSHVEGRGQDTVMTSQTVGPYGDPAVMLADSAREAANAPNYVPAELEYPPRFQTRPLAVDTPQRTLGKSSKTPPQAVVSTDEVPDYDDDSLYSVSDEENEEHPSDFASSEPESASEDDAEGDLEDDEADYDEASRLDNQSHSAADADWELETPLSKNIDSMRTEALELLEEDQDESDSEISAPEDHYDSDEEDEGLESGQEEHNEESPVSHVKYDDQGEMIGNIDHLLPRATPDEINKEAQIGKELVDPRDWTHIQSPLEPSGQVQSSATRWPPAEQKSFEPQFPEVAPLLPPSYNLDTLGQLYAQGPFVDSTYPQHPFTGTNNYYPYFQQPQTSPSRNWLPVPDIQQTEDGSRPTFDYLPYAGEGLLSPRKTKKVQISDIVNQDVEALDAQDVDNEQKRNSIKPQVTSGTDQIRREPKPQTLSTARTLKRKASSISSDEQPVEETLDNASYGSPEDDGSSDHGNSQANASINDESSDSIAHIEAGASIVPTTQARSATNSTDEIMASQSRSTDGAVTKKIKTNDGTAVPVASTSRRTGSRKVLRTFITGAIAGAVTVIGAAAAILATIPLDVQEEALREL